MPPGGHGAPREEPERGVDDVLVCFWSLGSHEKHHT